jgi:nicotinate-nucleotide adenylyltransferase
MCASIGLFGGTFDPIHFGHLRLAEELAEVLGIGQVRFIPAGQPPHRGSPRAAASHRLEMARRAVAGNPRFVIDASEIERNAPSYSVDTLTALRAELPPKTPLVLFMGGDAFLGLNTWHEWRRIFDLTHIAVAHRPGYSLASWEDALPDPLRTLLHPQGVRRIRNAAEPQTTPLSTRRCEQAAELKEKPAGLVFLHTITQLDISASQIRDRALQGKSLRYLLPDSVINYINENHLYA